MDNSVGVGEDQGIIINVLRAAPTQNFLDDVEYCKRNEEDEALEIRLKIALSKNPST